MQDLPDKESISIAQLGSQFHANQLSLLQTATPEWAKHPFKFQVYIRWYRIPYGIVPLYQKLTCNWPNPNSQTSTSKYFPDPRKIWVIRGQCSNRRNWDFWILIPSAVMKMGQAHTGFFLLFGKRP